MKKIIALTLSLLALDAFAINPNTTWHSMGKRLTYEGKQTVAKSGYETKQGAVDAALGLVEDFQSGDMSKATRFAFRSSITLWDKEKCRSNSMFRVVEKEMAKGRFEVMNIKVNSYFTGSGNEVFSYSVRYYAPCVLKDRD